MLPSPELIDLLLKSSDIVTQMLDTEKAGNPPVAGLGADLIAAMQSATEGKPSPLPSPSQVKPVAPGEKYFEIVFTPHESLYASGNDPIMIIHALERLGDLELTADLSRITPVAEMKYAKCLLGWSITLKTAATEETVGAVFDFVRDISDIKISQKNTASAPAEVHAEAKKATGDEHAAKSAGATSIRVDLDKIDRLVNMVGELVITEAMLRAQVRHLSTDRFSDLLRGVAELSHHTRELQKAVMAVRMQPVKSVFSRIPRIVRDTAAQLGKDIQLVLSGENTEVDKTVIEQLSDPLVHMIRNSVDHGVETPDERVKNGKPAQGTIHLSAYHRSGRIIIEIQDDGKGIARERVLAKAKEKGLVATDAALSDEEIDHLIFLPGFSTAEKVTNVSGRGVGMDVVTRNIEGLSGTVRLTNTPGKGSLFTVSLPLTLAILDGMIVRVGNENYIIPITSIIETLRPQNNEVHHVQDKGHVINVRGEFVPLVYLHRIFTVSGAQNDPGQALVVLVESGNAKIGLMVDELIGQQQVVIKSLEANADPVKGISGATILGDGKVSLILEINELKELCNSRENAAALQAA